jgi:hypothetical protein
MTRCCIAVLALLIATVVLHGQEPEPRRLYAGDGLLPADKPQEVIACGDWHTDIIFGLPIALRAQRRIGSSDFWGEGGLAIYTFVPSVFVGLRRDGGLYEGKRNTFYVRPGFDFYYSPVNYQGGFLFGRIRSMTALTFDADLTWRRKWSERFHGHLGLKVGIGVGTAGHGAFPLPILGLTAGCQY